MSVYLHVKVCHWSSLLFTQFVISVFNFSVPKSVSRNLSHFWHRFCTCSTVKPTAKLLWASLKISWMEKLPFIFSCFSLQEYLCSETLLWFMVQISTNYGLNLINVVLIWLNLELVCQSPFLETKTNELRCTWMSSFWRLGFQLQRWKCAGTCTEWTGLFT